MKRHPVLCAVLAAAALGPSFARAGDARCVWNSISPAARAGVVARYRQDGLATATTYQLPTLDLLVMGDRCVRDGGVLQHATVTLFLSAMRDDVTARLRGLGEDPTALNADWTRGLTAADRATFRRYLKDRAGYRPMDPSQTAVVTWLVSRPHVKEAIQVNGKDFITIQTVLDYYLVIARLEDAEAEF
jgi:hypothetical protein